MGVVAFSHARASCPCHVIVFFLFLIGIADTSYPLGCFGWVGFCMYQVLLRRGCALLIVFGRVLDARRFFLPFFFGTRWFQDWVRGWERESHFQGLGSFITGVMFQGEQEHLLGAADLFTVH